MNDHSAAQRVGRARSLGSSADAAAVYAEWAATYDDDVFGTLGFTGSDRIADLLAAHLPDRGAAVLDIGCGTGAVGVRLRHHGFSCVDGIDISSEMLEVAAAKHAYRHLAVTDLTIAPRFPVALYAASVSAGTFTTGHVGVEALDDVLGAHQPGAVVAWVIAVPLWPSFEGALGSLDVRTVSAEVEPVRRGGDAESVMFVGTIGGADRKD